MRIIAALFIEDIQLRQVPGPATRIDLTGVQFSAAAPEPVPLTLAPHLVVLVHCPADEEGFGALEVVYKRDGEQVARNVQALQVEPGRFNYRLIRAELEFTEYGLVEAHCRIDGGTETIVPYTLLPPGLMSPAPVYAAALSEHPLATQAVGEVVGAVVEALGPGPPPDMAVLFVTAPHTGVIAEIAGTVRSTLHPTTLFGTTASSIVGGAREVEDSSAIALWAARLAEPVVPVRIEAHQTPSGWLLGGLPDAATAEYRTLVLVADPFTFPTDSFVEATAERLPQLRVVGGLASAARGPGGNRLVLDGAIHTDGAVGVLLPEAVTAASVVSQGCRPIGDPMIVTRAERNVVYELAGQSALERLVTLLSGLAPDERALAQRGLHLGIVIDEHKLTFERGDFLVRNVLGADRDAGAIAVGDAVEVGATVQFQVRDAHSADEDLRALFAGRHAGGALVFTCNGRGTHLFGRPDHDAGIVDAAVTGHATAGMFCAGEIGPVGGRSFLHGFTASVLLLGGVGDPRG